MNRAILASMGVAVLLASPAFSAPGAPISENTNAASRIQGSFLSRVTAARPAGMGESFTAIANDAAGTAFNPGGLCQIVNYNAVLMYGRISEGIAVTNVAAAYNVGFGTAGISLTRLDCGSYSVRDSEGNITGVETIADTAGSLSMALPYPDWLGLPGSAGVMAEIVNEDAGSVMVGFGLGGVVRASPTMKFGFSITHLGPASKGFHLPATARIGGAMAVSSHAILALDAIYGMYDRRVGINVGTEITPIQPLVLRAGNRWLMKAEELKGLTGISAGFGVRFASFGLDYAYQPFGELATSHLFSLEIGKH